MRNLIEINHLNKKYPTFTLKDVSFTLPGGYIGGFIGPNGAGKTTTIKALLNIIQPDSGSISLAVKPDSLGIVMDNPFYPDDWTMLHVEKALSLFYTHWNSAEYRQYLSRFGIHQTKKVKELSRGMKVKLQLAAALSHNASLLILDEPTSGLDPIARDEICGLLQDFVLDEKHAVLFSTHITSDLEKIADSITYLLHGEVIFSGTKEALLEQYRRISGGLQDITEGQKSLIIGFRKHSVGFEGMIKSSDLRKFSSRVLTEPVTLDEIIIFMNKGESLHA